MFKVRGWRILIGIVAFVLLTGCKLDSVTEPHTFDPDLEPTPVPTAVAVAKPTYVVERGTVALDLTLSGRVVPATETAVSFGLNGVVAAVYVENGEFVAAGELLAELNTAAYLAERNLAESALAVAEAQVAAVEAQQENDRRRAEIALEQVQIQLNFAITDAGSNPTPAQQMAIDLLELDVELAQLTLAELNAGVPPGLVAEVEQAQLRLEEIDSLIANAQLVAPVSGTVVRLLVATGDNVVSGDTAVVLADLTQLEIEALVRDEDIRDMVEGMAATTMFAAQPGGTYSVTVKALPLPYGTAENLAESTARFAFDNASDLADFAVGDRLLLELILVQHEDTLWLPPAAVRDFQGRNFVVIQEEGGSQRRVDVQPGIESSSRIEILEGVTEGDIVVGP